MKISPGRCFWRASTHPIRSQNFSRVLSAALCEPVGMPRSRRRGGLFAALTLSLIPLASPFSAGASAPWAAPSIGGGPGEEICCGLGQRMLLRGRYRGERASRGLRDLGGSACMSGDGAWSGFEQQAGLPARFPMRVEDAMEDAGQSVLDAIDEGVARVRIQLNLPEFDPSEMLMEKGCLLSFVNGLGGGLVDRGLRANFVFNTVQDAANANRLISPELSENISINVLGLDDFSQNDDICVLMCPSNEGKDLRRIEDVERLLYAGPPKSMVTRAERKKFLSRPFVLVNPNLEAIHQHSTGKHKVAPMFMSDFTTAYFLDPRAMVSRRSEAAILRRYPSQWQLWMRSSASNNESSQYRLLWERTTVPSPSDLSPFLEDLDDRISRIGLDKAVRRTRLGIRNSQGRSERGGKGDGPAGARQP